MPSQRQDQSKGTSRIAAPLVLWLGFVAGVPDSTENGRIVCEAEMDATDTLAGGTEVNREATLRCRCDELRHGISEVAIGGRENAEEA